MNDTNVLRAGGLVSKEEARVWSSWLNRNIRIEIYSWQSKELDQL
jgi:hypothetical protein